MFLPEAPSPIAFDPADLPLGRIEHEIEELAAHINAGSARWLDLVAEFDRREGWRDTGCRSCSEWIAWRCGLNPRAAREHVRVARRIGDLPLIREAFSRGELSYSKVRALTRVAEPEDEVELLELARHATAAQLERIVRAARRVTAAEADEAHRESYLRWHWDEEGCLCVDGRLPPEDGALFLRSLESARDALHQKALDERAGAEDCDESDTDRGSAEPLRPPPSPTNAESLAAVAEAALARPPTGLPGGERYQVLVHVDAETLATDEPGAHATGHGSCAIADGPGIAAETVRRLCCDSSLVTILERDGEPLAVGDRSRTIPPSTRRALVARDGHCQFPGCERWRFVDAHHIKHWARGGETTLENLILLCRYHHRLVHEGGIGIDRDEHGRHRFTLPGGTVLRGSPAPPASAPSRLREHNGARGLEITSDTYLPGSGEGMDLGACVEAVLVAKDRRPRTLAVLHV